jgi:uncharacterized membrane protein (UPF0127 family)
MGQGIINGRRMSACRGREGQISKVVMQDKDGYMDWTGGAGCKILLAPVNRFDKISFTMTIRLALFVGFAASAALVAGDVAQPELPVTKLHIGAAEVRAEVADDDRERAAGLMFREVLGENSGMLFVMPSTGPASFWMKNTLVPLSIAFIGPDGTVLEIHDMASKSEKVTRSLFPGSPLPSRCRRDGSQKTIFGRASGSPACRNGRGISRRTW